MTTMTTTRIRRLAGSAIAVTSALLVVVPGQAAAANPHALQTTFDSPLAGAAPGGTGTVQLQVKNVGSQATQGVLINIALPPHVTLPVLAADKHCQHKADPNVPGGSLISCNMSDKNDPRAQVSSGHTNTDDAEFTVDKQGVAPFAHLGTLVVVTVPLVNGKSTEDWRDETGPNTARTEIFSL